MMLPDTPSDDSASFDDGLYAGVMSGTSLDGIDAVIARFISKADGRGTLRCDVLGCAFLSFPEVLRIDLMALQSLGDDELARGMRASLALASLYAQAVQEAASRAGVSLRQLRAAGVHGQTVRHCPEEGWSCQLNHPARIAELLSVDTVADFRSRDLAAGGQGAPLVPAFHQALFRHSERQRAIVNIGGMANITVVSPGGEVQGFDMGPGNVLLDIWHAMHQGAAFDDGGRWAASGQPVPALLDGMLADPFFAQAPPKSTGRDRFNSSWLKAHVQRFNSASAADVQATLLQLTVRSIADAVQRYTADSQEVFVCGGGVRNSALMEALSVALSPRRVQSTETVGVDAQHVEALAFAWLARETLARRPGNVPAVTGAAGPRILGAVYPA